VKTIRLSRATLPDLPGHVRGPSYTPASVAAGIVHLGIGGFHRAHMARFTHDLFDIEPSARGWGIVGAGLLPSDRRMQDVLAAQNGLYTLIERSVSEETVSVIGSIAGLVNSADDSTALLQIIDRPSIRIVSLTVTENGYCLNAATKKLNLGHPTIASDLSNPERPHSAVAIIAEALRRRMIAGRPAFTALSCDNIQHNGNVLRQAVLECAECRDAKLAAWIERNGRFPNTMVDRITPVTSAEAVADLAARHGIDDGCPVFCETFRQWVIEDDFAQGRPQWERVGAQFVGDVAPYEFMKLRLLNTSHLAIAGLGRLAGYSFIDEAMGDARLRRYMRALMDRETGPTLPPVPGIDLGAYKATLIERFANPNVKDTVERVNTDAPLNVLVDPIRDRLRRGGSVELLALALAAWMRRMRGMDERGERIDIRHPVADLLREKAVAGGADPRPLLGIEQLFGELAHDERLVNAAGKWLGSLYAIGAAETLARAELELRF
jgi:mannitol-1-phosphate/altronate dehydrogenase